MPLYGTSKHIGLYAMYRMAGDMCLAPKGNKVPGFGLYKQMQENDLLGFLTGKGSFLRRAFLKYPPGSYGFMGTVYFGQSDVANPPKRKMLRGLKPGRISGLESHRQHRYAAEKVIHLGGPK